ncbi:hypothetical protein KVR01_007101 [Diaporthe batatas]|uniref:uncharacterized protein n=1 Tax=Diaporthe batatas TaxID=748121 RepID=UPI001D04FA7C|nr:uncharacterized protein KVR01_007101 [Diaporthe batatas]KAG8162623.1 hypothetical protein KVR01_007101 [Diaporthe batatas]
MNALQIEMATGPKRESFHWQSDTTTDAPTTTCSINTPSTTAAGPDCLCSSRGAVPCPEKTFQIIEKRSGKAITLAGDELKLEKVGPTRVFDRKTHWFCVKKDGYFGFQNPKTGNYLGHDGGFGIRASANYLNQSGLWTPREHPEGGYEMLSPHGASVLMVLCDGGDGSTLVTRWHGTTLWEFVRV